MSIDSDIESFLKDQSETIVPVQTTKALSIFEQADKKDEIQILDEFKGVVITEYIYRFTNKKGKVITGLAYAGVKAIISDRGKMSILSHELVKEEGFWYATVKIRDEIKQLDGLGIAECSIMKPFARRIALSMALRNAYRSIIDEALILKMVEKWEKI